MKKILLLLMTALTFLAVAAKDTQPPFILELNVCQDDDFERVNVLRNDTNICCTFEIIQQNGIEDFSRVYHKESGVLLGTFSGIPTPNILKDILRTQLKPEYVAEIVPKILYWDDKERIQR